MRNKELKKGDRVWLSYECLSYDSCYMVISVKKKGTLVTVVAEGKSFIGDKKPYEITLYGHASSSLLSGFDRRFGNKDVYYTCDYDLIRVKTKRFERDQSLKEAGKALLNLVKYFKD